MFARLKLLVIPLIFAAALDACAGTGPATSPETDPGAPTIAGPTAIFPVSPSTVASQEPTALPKTGTLENGALMLDYSEPDGKVTLRLVDVTSGAAVPGHDPLTFAGVGAHAYLPGGQTLAIAVYEEADAATHPELVLLEIPSWTTTAIPLTLDGWVQAVTVSSDGSRIAVAGWGNRSNLTIVDALRGVAIATASVPNQVRALAFTQDGSGLMVYASNEDTTQGLSQGAPQALLLTSDDLSMVWQTDLAGVRDAFEPGQDYDGQSHEPGAGTRYSPGLAFSPAADALYAIHADEDRLTRVDFASRQVAALDIRPALSFVERILSLGALVAHAKVQNGTEKDVAVSPDGSLLYVTGIDHHFTLKDNGEWDLRDVPLGLQVVDAATGAELETLATAADRVALLPDGLVLLQALSGEETSSEVYDPAARKIILRYPGLYQDCVPLMKGGYVLAPSYLPNRSIEMQVYYPGSEKVLSSWPIENPNSQWVSCSR